MTTRRRDTFLPRLEALESRDVPASLEWRPTVTNYWDGAGNWWNRSTNAAHGAAPTLSDDVSFDSDAGQDCVVRYDTAAPKTVMEASFGHDLVIQTGVKFKLIDDAGSVLRDVEFGDDAELWLAKNASFVDGAFMGEGRVFVYGNSRLTTLGTCTVIDATIDVGVNPGYVGSDGEISVEAGGVSMIGLTAVTVYPGGEILGQVADGYFSQAVGGGGEDTYFNVLGGTVSVTDDDFTFAPIVLATQDVTGYGVLNCGGFTVVIEGAVNAGGHSDCGLLVGDVIDGSPATVVMLAESCLKVKAGIYAHWGDLLCVTEEDMIAWTIEAGAFRWDAGTISLGALSPTQQNFWPAALAIKVYDPGTATYGTAHFGHDTGDAVTVNVGVTSGGACSGLAGVNDTAIDLHQRTTFYVLWGSYLEGGFDVVDAKSILGWTDGTDVDSYQGAEYDANVVNAIGSRKALRLEW